MRNPAWQPNENQVKALEYARDHRYVYTQVALAEHVGISKQATYSWNESVGFRLWWTEKREEFLAAGLDQVQGMVYARAVGMSEAGSTPDAKLFLERFDPKYVPRERRELTGADGAPLKTYVCIDVDKVVGREALGHVPEQDALPEPEVEYDG